MIDVCNHKVFGYLCFETLDILNPAVITHIVSSVKANRCTALCRLHLPWPQSTSALHPVFCLAHWKARYMGIRKNIYIYIYIYIYIHVIPRSPLGRTSTEIKSEIWVSCIRSGSVLPWKKCSDMTLLFWWGLELFETRKIWMSISSFKRSGNVLPQQQCLVIALFFF